MNPGANKMSSCTTPRSRGADLGTSRYDRLKSPISGKRAIQETGKAATSIASVKDLARANAPGSKHLICAAGRLREGENIMNEEALIDPQQPSIAN
jgi:hypothetical protein